MLLILGMDLPLSTTESQQTMMRTIRSLMSRSVPLTTTTMLQLVFLAQTTFLLKTMLSLGLWSMGSGMKVLETDGFTT